MKGVIFDIKRFSLHDGYGIRSTLFLKGCPLRCSWCHNPEGISKAIRLWHFPSKCLGCSSCIRSCPKNALRAQSGGEHFIVIDYQACVQNARCVEACPAGALRFDGQEITVEAAVEKLLEDKLFYQTSGGGVTISGGEPAAQYEFTSLVLKALQEEHIHTAIETSACCDAKVMTRLLKNLDLCMVDFKLSDETLHLRYTGGSNTLIKRNIPIILEECKDVLVRIPLIPGITATAENIRGIGQYLTKQKRKPVVELLNYNPLAENKYRIMDKPNGVLLGLTPLSNPEIDRLAGILTGMGLTVISPVKEQEHNPPAV
jgi:pyruvate formate lyase activating enzyme